MSPDVKRFLKKLSLALLAAGLFAGFSVGFLFYSGEMLPVEKVVEMRVRSPGSVSMYGCLYSSPKLYYQWQVVLRTAPEVLAFGTSRNQEMRSEFFRAGVTFYNASNPASKLESYKYFVDSIPPGREPSVLIVGLDQFFFNRAWEYYSAPLPPASAFSPEQDYSEILKLGIPGVHRDLIRDGLPHGLISLRRDGRIGLSALLDNNGLRADGSLSVNTARIKPSRHNDALRFVESGRSAFAYGFEVYPAALERLEEFLSACRARGIYVVAFLPPYAHCVYEAMSAKGDKYAYLARLRAVLPGVFRRHGFGFHDFTDLKDVGASDLETIDGYHGSEKAYLRLFIRMAGTDPRLGRLTDVPLLKARLAAAADDFTVFGDRSAGRHFRGAQ